VAASRTSSFTEARSRFWWSRDAAGVPGHGKFTPRASDSGLAHRILCSNTVRLVQGLGQVEGDILLLSELGGYPSLPTIHRPDEGETNLAQSIARGGSLCRKQHRSIH
jgi:hypothetical protein